MKRQGFFVLSLALLLVTSAAAAADFDWVRDFNTRAQADPAGFRASIAARFQIGDAQITAVLGNVSGPADAYIVLRYGEMSRHPTDYVLRDTRHPGARAGECWRSASASSRVRKSSTR